MVIAAADRVDNSTLQTRVYAALRERIVNGFIQPGEAFTIRALANAMGTSVMPVREALTRLHAEGAVEINPTNRQIRIPIISRDGVMELYKLRIELEGMAAAMAAKAVSSEEIAQLEQLVDDMRKAVEDGRELDFMQANYAFHFTVYRAARSHHLLPIIEMLWLKFGPLLRVPLAPGSRMENRVMDGAQEHHEDLVEALRRGDARKARKAIRGDLGDTADWFDKHYDPEAYVKRNQIKQYAD